MSDFTLFTIQAHRVIGSFTFTTTTYYTGTSTVILQIPAMTSGGSSVRDVWDYVVLYTSGANLYRKTQVDEASSRTAGTKLLTGNLQSLIFATTMWI